MGNDHEDLHERREREADELEDQGDALGGRVEDAKDANARLESDQLIATPVREDDESDEDGDSGDDPPPEAEYPAKD